MASTRERRLSFQTTPYCHHRPACPHCQKSDPWHKASSLTSKAGRVLFQGTREVGKMSRALVTMQSYCLLGSFQLVYLPLPIIPLLPQTVVPTQEADSVQLAVTVHPLGQILNSGWRPRASAHIMATGTQLHISTPHPHHSFLLSLPHFLYDSLHSLTHMMGIYSYRNSFLRLLGSF